VLAVVIVMVLILLLAGAVAAYVAYPHRGEELPVAPWLGDAMTRAADAAPVLEVEYEDSERKH
jgi:hypothetical protein